jgi:hypothetical protein
MRGDEALRKAQAAGISVKADGDSLVLEAAVVFSMPAKCDAVRLGSGNFRCSYAVWELRQAA